MKPHIFFPSTSRATAQIYGRQPSPHRKQTDEGGEAAGGRDGGMGLDESPFGSPSIEEMGSGEKDEGKWGCGRVREMDGQINRRKERKIETQS